MGGRVRRFPSAFDQTLRPVEVGGPLVEGDGQVLIQKFRPGHLRQGGGGLGQLLRPVIQGLGQLIDQLVRCVGPDAQQTLGPKGVQILRLAGIGPGGDAGGIVGLILVQNAGKLLVGEAQQAAGLLLGQPGQTAGGCNSPAVPPGPPAPTAPPPPGRTARWWSPGGRPPGAGRPGRGHIPSPPPPGRSSRRRWSIPPPPPAGAGAGRRTPPRPHRRHRPRRRTPVPGRCPRRPDSARSSWSRWTR